MAQKAISKIEQAGFLTDSGDIRMSQAQRQAANSPYTKKQVWMALAAIMLAYFLYAYILQTWNVAAPKIAADLNGMALYSWSVSIPSLGLAMGTLLAGKFSDIFGRRALLIASTIISFLSTALCA